ncbi:Dehydratase family protein [Streptomyces melanosporofaciens]|uniref:Dehydratase family protein n=1 Tax=Streptomyces melanosporofaciens TaxID=67327 RepID=A0A1H4KIX9_STRMJ|nr:Dehydratase family protein [Streptomyces melanosporofaciens]
MKLRISQWYSGQDRNAYIQRPWMRRGVPDGAFTGRPQGLAVEMVGADRRPATFLTKASFHNAIVALAAVGGSTNAVVHLLAIAGKAASASISSLSSMRAWKSSRSRRRRPGLVLPLTGPGIRATGRSAPHP